VLRHGVCTSLTDCHDHTIQRFDGVARGSFVAPDHAYPSSLALTLTATDANGLTGTTRVVLQPTTTTLRLESSPTGLDLALHGTSAATPATHTVIVGSTNTLSAPSLENRKGKWVFVRWSDGGAQTHTVTAPTTAMTYTATYQRR